MNDLNKIELYLLVYFLFILTNKLQMEFNIEDYINSLPLSTTKINVSKKRLTYLPDLSRFKQLTHLICSSNKLTYLPPLNNTLTHLYCDYNQLTELPPLNNNLTVLYCHHNQLTWLPPLNYKLERLYCSYNELTELPPLNNNLTQLYCHFNNLTSLPPLNNILKILNCHHNQLTWLPPLNNNLQELICYNNNIYNENIEKYKYNYRNIKIIQTLRNFRNTYYLLKFKKHFKRWLWEKVREPKIMAKFHPSHLDALEETDDLQVFLDDWIKNDKK
jgi:Leucine-rich repeat (LRR) protein